jgi:hypothetical protein
MTWEEVYHRIYGKAKNAAKNALFLALPLGAPVAVLEKGDAIGSMVSALGDRQGLPALCTCGKRRWKRSRLSRLRAATVFAVSVGVVAEGSISDGRRFHDSARFFTTFADAIHALPRTTSTNHFS